MKRLFNITAFAVFALALVFNLQAINQIDGSRDFVVQEQTAVAYGTWVNCYGDYNTRGEDSELVCYANLSEGGFDYCVTIENVGNPTNIDQCEEEEVIGGEL